MNTKIDIAFFILLLLIIFKLIRKEVPICLRYISYSMMKLSHYSKQLGVFIEKFESRNKK
ncbi:hypothetical protein ABEW34_01350 [Paenibacillus algorifonticola]|uniref:hypothetical protein n=1 Tax=Paenibacillus algorifonticola TaxID=684063 RepID=UPI003D2686CD